MADLVITAASVLAAADASIDFSHRAGEALAQGKQVYFDSTAKKWMLADSNSATAEARQASGTALNAAALNQPVAVAKNGSKVTIGATLVPGTDYYLSDTPGGICPIADVGTGEYVCRVGMALSAADLQLDYLYTGVVK
jgi:hypothetical protein